MKDSHFTGQPVYSQVFKLLDNEKILRINRKTKGSEAYVKRLDGYRHLSYVGLVFHAPDSESLMR